MTDSTDNKLTYNRILERAKQNALDAIEQVCSFPKTSTYENWESYQQEVEDIDAYEVAHESSDWDWVIYYHRAMELCRAVPSDVLHEAESDCSELGYADEGEFGLYETAATIASQIVIRAIADAVEEVKEELIDLAQTNMENF